MAKLRFDNNDEVWVIDTKAWNVARRNANNRFEQALLHTQMKNRWERGLPGYRVQLMPFASRHLWFWIDVEGRKIRVHDSEVIRV